jgi:Tol biopolymer transport system component
MKARLVLVSLGVLVLVSSLFISTVLAIFGMERVSVSATGNPGDSASYNPSVSADGRYVAFQSRATNLVPGVGNGHDQIFVCDRRSKTIILASIGYDGYAGDGDSVQPSMSADGRYVVFESFASNLVRSGTGISGTFLRDLASSTTSLISVNPSGYPGNNYSFGGTVSADGRFVAFSSASTDLVSPATSGNQVFLRDRHTNTTTLISVDSSGNPGNDDSYGGDISSDGHYVGFWSSATNIVPGTVGDHYNMQVFIRNLQSNTTTLVSTDYKGNPGKGMSLGAGVSSDGRYVVFGSDSSDLVPGYSGFLTQVFVHDCQANSTKMVSVDSNGHQMAGYSQCASISPDGHYIAFASFVQPPIGGKWYIQVYVRNLQDGTTTIISTDPTGKPCDATNCWGTGISAYGNHIAFASDATNLIPGNSNGTFDVFVATPLPPNTPLASVNTSLGPVNFSTNAGSISGLTNIPPENMPCSSGGFIFPYGMFSYSITNLAPGATATVTVRTPIAIPMGARVFKCQNGNLIDFSANSSQLDPNTFVLTLKDGGQGDSDGQANGTIVDPCGMAFMDTSPHQSSAPQIPKVAQGPAPIANIAVQSASLSTAKVAPGTPVTITADVANKGTADGSTQIKLFVNGQEEAHQGVTLASGSRTPVKFTVSRDEPGTYSVYVGSIPAGTFEVNQFADPNLVLYISGALILLALVGGVVFMATRKR